MDLEETEAKNDYAGEDQQEFNRPTDRSGSMTTGTPKKEACLMQARLVTVPVTARHLIYVS
jgi:hypothetical protein